MNAKYFLYFPRGFVVKRLLDWAFLPPRLASLLKLATHQTKCLKIPFIKGDQVYTLHRQVGMEIFLSSCVVSPDVSRVLTWCFQTTNSPKDAN